MNFFDMAMKRLAGKTKIESGFSEATVSANTVASKNVENSVHNFPVVTNTGNRNVRNFSYWKERVKEIPEWLESSPLDLEEDPLQGISSKTRWRLAKEVWPKEETVIDTGIPVEEWERLYVTEFYKTFMENHPKLFQAQREIIIMYSEAPIALRKKVHIGFGPSWRRGDRGNIVNRAGIELLPDPYRAEFKKSLDAGFELAHIQGFICTLDKNVFRFVKA